MFPSIHKLLLKAQWSHIYVNLLSLQIQMHELNGSGANAVLRDYHLLEFKFPREFRVRRMTCTTGPGKFCLAFELADGQILVYK